MGIWVHGGTDGISANRAEMRALAGLLDRGVDDLDELCDLLDRVECLVIGRDLFEHHHRAPRALFEALDQAQSGRHGPHAIRSKLRDHAAYLRFAARLYGHHERSLLSRIGGALHEVGEFNDIVGPAAVAGAVAVAEPLAARPAAAWAESRIESVLTHDPELVDDAANAALLPLDRALAPAVPDGHPVVTDLGIDTDLDASAPPTGVATTLGQLEDRDNDAATVPGDIDVRIMTGADGRRRGIVDITGTEDWSPIPGRDIADLSTDEKALLGRSTNYAKGVEQAMRQAGVRPTDQVLVAGHSLGGMVAVEVARDAGRSHDFDVTDVVTAGSPIGLTVGRLPTSIKVLALENDDDVVPHADGRSNPDRPNITTVTFHAGDGQVGDDHSLPSYLHGADEVDASTDPSVLAWKKDAHGFFDDTAVVTHAYQITRG